MPIVFLFSNWICIIRYRATFPWMTKERKPNRIFVRIFIMKPKQAVLFKLLPTNNGRGLCYLLHCANMSRWTSRGFNEILPEIQVIRLQQSSCYVLTLMLFPYVLAVLPSVSVLDRPHPGDYGLSRREHSSFGRFFGSSDQGP